MVNVKTGSIIWVNFPGVTGIKRRPTVVISSDYYHNARPDIVCSVITSQVAKATYKTDYVLQDWSSAGLTRPSAFRCFIQTLPAKDVLSISGQVSSRDWKEIEARLKISLAIS